MNLTNESNQEEGFTLPLEALEPYLLTLFIVAAATAILYAIGRDVLGEGVIALLYLAPLSWVSARWGQGPGILAAVTSALAFDFLFIPPFYTFNVGSLEGWLLLGIFLLVAIVIVGRIQVGFREAQRREHEAILMYELSNDLATVSTRETVAQALAAKVYQYYQAEQVQVVILAEDASGVIVGIPPQASVQRKVDLIVPILSANDLIGEVRLWEGNIPLPQEGDRMLGNLTNQSALALERAQLIRAASASL